MTILRTNPATVHHPLGGYSHAVRVPAPADLLFISGQVGVDPEGQTLQGVRNQTRQALANLTACLEADGMSIEDVVRLTVYLIDPRHISDMIAERRAVFGYHQHPTSTLLIVSGLAQSDLLVEIDAVAASRG
jgi:enamine deaminase RidA (YjgF/YER057c/UK114 family)